MALFAPDPDEFDIEEFVEQLGVDLGDRYRAVEDDLIRELASRLYRDVELQSMLPGAPVRGGLTVEARREQNRILTLLAAHRAESMRALQALVTEMVADLRRTDIAQQIVELAATQGESAAAAQLGLARGLPAVTGSASQAVAALVIDLQSRLEVMNQRITRFPQDAYQQVVSLTAPSTLLGVTTSLVQQQRTVRTFLQQGVDGFVDVSGRRWRIGSYAEMAGRTAVNRAFNDAAVWRMQQVGVKLGTIVGGFDACAKCAPWIGKVVSLDGSPAGPRLVQHATDGTMVTVTVHGTIQQARNAGWNHPNCRDRVVAYMPGLSTPQASFEYNADAEKERIRQRELERDIRAAKRDVATAPDAVSRRRAQREVAEAQAAMRDFTASTGRARQSYREQLHFADGQGAKYEPRTPKPADTKPPVGGLNVMIPKTTKLGAEVAAARSSIASLHTIPRSLPPVLVESARLRSGLNGVYYGSRGVLQMSTAGSSPQLTLAHEVGHYLDHVMLGSTTSNYETRALTNPLTREWLAAVHGTDSVRSLEALLKDPGTPAEIAEHVRYLLQPVELWGRSYAQFVATRASNTAMLDEIASFRASPAHWTANRQWDTKEFEQVADSIEAILRERGVWK